MMRRRQTHCAVLAFCAALAGCNNSPPPAPPPTPAPAAPAQPAGPVSFDGTYNGMKQLTRGSAMSCGTQDPMTIRVANNAFRYVLNQPLAWQPTRSFAVTVAPDGSFISQSGPAMMRGQISGGHMQGEIADDACGFQFEADSSGTW